MKKLPDDAFAFYLALGLGRSYQAVADHFNVGKKTVTNRAVKEGWKAKLEDHEREQRKIQEKKAAESLEAMNDRHLKVLSFVQAKGIEALKTMPIESAIDAVRALAIAIEKERLIRGEPTERSAIDIEKKIREEHDRWLTPVGPESPAVEVPATTEAQKPATEAPSAEQPVNEVPPTSAPPAEKPPDAAEPPADQAA